MLIALLGTPAARAAGPVTVQARSEIDYVLVYSTQARVFRKATATTSTTQARIRVATLPTSIDASSVQVGCKSATVQRVEVSVERGRLPRQAKAEELVENFEALNLRQQAVRDERQLLQNERSFIQGLRLKAPPKNPNRAQAEGLFVDGWRRILAWSGARGATIEKRLQELRKDRNALAKERHKLQVEANKLDLGAVDRPMLQVVATVKGRRGKHRLTLSYVTRSAGWRSSYDLRYDHTQGRVEAIYYAEVFQRSGEDWSGASLRFSTAQPLQLLAIPELPTWTLGRKRDFTPKPSLRHERNPGRWHAPALPRITNVTVQRLRALLQGRVTTDGLGVRGVGRGGGGVGYGKLSNEHSRRDYKARPKKPRRYKRRSRSRPPAPVMAAPAPVALDMAEAEDAPRARPESVSQSSSGRRIQSSRLRASRRREPPREVLPWTDRGYRPPSLPPSSPAAAAQGYVFTLHAPGRHDVPSNGKRRRVPVLRKRLGVQPNYKIVPGRSKSAYVVAELKNTTGRPILRGQANLFSGKMFSGRSYINTALPGHTLRLPLGVDDSVKVERHLRQKTVTQGTFFRDDITEYTVAIEIANHRRRSIQVELKEQIPLKRGKKVEIKDIRFFSGKKTQKGHKPTVAEKRLAGWTKPDDNGHLFWKGKIGPNKVKKLSFTFRIVRPKDWMLRQHGG